MKYRDLREFMSELEPLGELKRIPDAVSPDLEMTAVSDAVLQAGGPALLFQNPAGYRTCVLTNLFGTTRRVALGMGVGSIDELRDVGRVLASLKEPEPPAGIKDAGRILQLVRSLWHMQPAVLRSAPCREVVFEAGDIDLGILPIQTCWPDDAGPLITWGLVITRGPQGMPGARRRQNLGIYRQQVIGRRQVIMRWLAHRGGALDFRDFRLAKPGQPFPIAVALGTDPATMLGAVTPVPDALSEYQFAGLLRGSRTELTEAAVGDAGVMLQVPASAEIVLEGFIPACAQGFEGRSERGIALKEINGYLHALEGPFGDHTGYYNEQEWFPVFELNRLTHRREPIYHSTYTGKPPDEPAMLGVALNEVFIPLLQKQFPEIVDFYLPPEGCSYRLAVVSIRKAYPGHAKRVMFGIWSFLRQFMYTKFIIVTDDDISIRNWLDVVWAMTTRVDPVRDTTLVDQAPIDYLDFASPVSGLGGKMGIDATHKWPAETARPWGRGISLPQSVRDRVRGVLDQILDAPPRAAT